MKKLLLSVAILLLICAIAPSCAFADSSSNQTVYSPEGKNYKLATVSYNGTKYIRFSGYYFGTSGIAVVAEIYPNAEWDLDFNINGTLTQQQLATREKLVALFNEVDDFINKVDSCANTLYRQSDVSAYNQAVSGTRLSIQKETYEMLAIAREMYVQTEGAFNPAVYRLVDLWGFSSRIYTNFLWGEQPYDREGTVEFDLVSNLHLENYPLPEQKYIDAFSNPQFTDFSQQAVTLEQDGEQYFVTKNVQPAKVDGVAFQQWLDLGGIAKGYVTDGIKEMFAQLNIDRYYIDAGSSSSVYGKFINGANHSFLLRDTGETSTMLLGFETENTSVSTSGQYIRKYTTNGVEYSHIMDGTTGSPAQTGVTSVSVLVPQSEGLWAGKSDCLTTALTVMGRDKIVEFVNGYLKQHNITVVVVYQTLDGQKQIISNLEQSQLTQKGPTFDDCFWALEKDANGTFAYTSAGIFGTNKNYKTLTIVLASVVGVAVVALVVYHFVKGKKNAISNLQNVRKEKPFKYGDIGIYMAVALLIVVLFGVFFGGDATQTQSIQCVRVTDMTNEETLFYYNAVRNEFEIAQNNANGWTVEVVQNDGQTLVVLFTKTVNGEQRFNKLEITRGANPTVKMADALCGTHKDCVTTFGTLKMPTGVIVCSPNLLKVVTE